MKRLFVLLLSGIILSSSVSIDSLAATNKTDIAIDPIGIIKGEPTGGSTTQPTQSGLEAAIKVVKSKIVVPEEYSEFNYNFNDATNYSDSYWTMTWSTTDGNAHISISCDADYHITYFTKYDNTNTVTGISKYLKKELKSKAEEFIVKTAPNTIGKLKYIDTAFEGIFSENYVYTYQREENGVAFPDNTVQVWVNSITGEVTALTVNWIYGVKIPSSSTKITKEEATKLLKKNLKMKLVYRTDYYGIYDMKGNAQKKAFLVYEPTEDYISVDAKTGEVYLTKSEWVQTGAGNSKSTNDAATEASAAATSNELTQAEIAKIEELKNIISKDKAIDIVTSNSSLYLDKNLKTYTATLNKQEDLSGNTSYVWSINLNDPREIDYTKTTDYYRAYAYATVDAVTGKILSFYSSVKSYYDDVKKEWKSVKIPYDKKESKAILEKFLKKQMSSRFSNTILSEENDDYIVYYKKEIPVYGGYNYQYNRVNEGVEYPYNSVYGSVDGVTGKIYSFGSNWDTNVVFESPKGAISADKALDYYLSKEGYNLKYEINQINKYDSSIKDTSNYDYSGLTTVEYEVRLVYRPDITPATISPFSGEQLSYDGTVYTMTKPYSYSDIKDEKAYRDILLLADMNIGFEGDKFLPDQAITVGEVNKLLSLIGYGTYTAEDETANDIKLITREEIAQSFISKLGLEKMAQLEGIYKTGYADEAMINAKCLGAVALAKGYGLLTADANNNFNPKSNITRFDAVGLIMKYIEVQKNGIY